MLYVQKLSALFDAVKKMVNHPVLGCKHPILTQSSMDQPTLL